MWSVSALLYLGVGRNRAKVGTERIAKVDLMHRRRDHIEPFGVESRFSNIVNAPKLSIELTTSRYFEP